MSATIGIDLGGTFIKGIVIDREGKILLEKRIPTLAERGSKDVIARMGQLVHDIKESVNRPLAAIGVTVPGVMRREEGIVELMPNFPPDQWRGVPLKTLLEEHTKLPVHLLNDARAATYAEKRFGSGKPFQNFVCLVIGTGIGGGLIVNDQLFLGSRGVAGELGHQVVVPNGLSCGCGNHGCLETVASGPAIVTAAIRNVKQGLPTLIRELVQGDLNLVTPELVAHAAEQGDPASLAIFETVANHLCTAIFNLKAVLNPEAVILGGGVAKSGLLLDLVRKRLEEKEVLFPASLGGMEIRRALLDDLAGAVGVAAWAMQNEEDLYHHEGKVEQR